MTSSSTPASVLPEQEKPVTTPNAAPEQKTEEQKKAEADKATEAAKTAAA